MGPHFDVWQPTGLRMAQCLLVSAHAAIGRVPPWEQLTNKFSESPLTVTYDYQIAGFNRLHKGRFFAKQGA